MVRNVNYLDRTMKTSIDRTYTAPGLMLALSMLMSPLHANSGSLDSGIPLSDVLTGTWRVDAVHIDSGATRALRYRHNDPRLKGRIFTISHEVLTANTPEEPACEMPTIAARITDIGKLVQNRVRQKNSPEHQSTSGPHIKLRIQKLQNPTDSTAYTAINDPTIAVP